MRRLLIHIVAAVLLIPVNGAHQLCSTHVNRREMCNDCATLQECKKMYAIVGTLEECTEDDLHRFNIMYNLLLQTIPSVTERQRYSGQFTCNLGATIAISLNSAYGSVCGNNEVPQLNAAQTNIFCMCKDSFCEVEYTDTVLNVLLICCLVLGFCFIGYRIIEQLLILPTKTNKQSKQRVTSNEYRGKLRMKVHDCL